VFCKPFARPPLLPLWLRKTPTDPHILADITVENPDGRVAKLNTYIYIYIYIYISELISDSYQYIPVAYITTHCMIGPYLTLR